MEYNESGSLVKETAGDDVTYYVWTAEEMLDRVQMPDESWSYFEYDGDLRRWEKTDPGATKLYRWDAGASGRPGLAVVQEADADGDTTAVFTHDQGATIMPGVGTIVSVREGDDSRFVHTDLQGTTRNVTSAAEAVIATYDLDAFGVQRSHTGAYSTPYLFTGKERDPGVGLDYFIARQYKAGRGAFLSKDPVGPRKGSYAYVIARPMARWDPTGCEQYTDPRALLNCLADCRRGAGAPLQLGCVGDCYERYGTAFPIAACALQKLRGGWRETGRNTDSWYTYVPISQFGGPPIAVPHAGPHIDPMQDVFPEDWSPGRPAYCTRFVWLCVHTAHPALPIFDPADPAKPPCAIGIPGDWGDAMTWCRWARKYGCLNCTGGGIPYVPGVGDIWISGDCRSRAGHAGIVFDVWSDATAALYIATVDANAPVDPSTGECCAYGAPEGVGWKVRQVGRSMCFVDVYKCLNNMRFGIAQEPEPAGPGLGSGGTGGSQGRPAPGSPFDLNCGLAIDPNNPDLCAPRGPGDPR